MSKFGRNSSGLARIKLMRTVEHALWRLVCRSFAVGVVFWRSCQSFAEVVQTCEHILENFFRFG